MLSMMRNLAVALSDLVQVNHHLRGLVVRPAGLLSIIPSSYERCEQILRELPFKKGSSRGEQAGAARRNRHPESYTRVLVVSNTLNRVG